MSKRKQINIKSAKNILILKALLITQLSDCFFLKKEWNIHEV